MAIVNVSEYASISTNANGGVPTPAGQPLATYDIAVELSSTAGPVLQKATKMVRLNADVACRVRISPDGIAVATDARFSAQQTEYWGINGAGLSVAVIQST